MAVGWGTVVNEQLLAVIGVEQFFSAIAIDPNQFARCHIKAAGGTVDSVIIAVYSRVVTTGGTGDDWSTVPDFTVTLDAATLAEIEFVIDRAHQARIGVVRSGSTDSFTVDLDYRIATLS